MRCVYVKIHKSFIKYEVGLSFFFFANSYEKEGSSSVGYWPTFGFPFWGSGSQWLFRAEQNRAKEQSYSQNCSPASCSSGTGFCIFNSLQLISLPGISPQSCKPE